jgi:hypothetical protein
MPNQHGFDPGNFAHRNSCWELFRAAYNRFSRKLHSTRMRKPGLPVRPATVPGGSTSWPRTVATVAMDIHANIHANNYQGDNLNGGK